MENVWKEIWPSSTVLGDYIYTNQTYFKDKIILELGAGYSAIPSMVAVKCGAKKVICTDKISADTPQIQKLQNKNFSKNLTKAEFKRIQISALDWNETKLTEDFISTLSELDIILGSDIFYDPTVFDSILSTINIVFKKFPQAEFIFAYQNRDSRWSIGCELKELNLKCERLHICIEEEHEISIGKITLAETSIASKTTSISTPTGTIAATAASSTKSLTTAKIMASGDTNIGRKRIYAGVEGGATNFNYIFIDADGNKLGEGTGLGLNILLEGPEGAADKIADALRQCAAESSIPLPIDSLGLGLSGAEDDEVNNLMIEYFQTKHSDICTVIHLTTDAVISIAATFSNGGVVIIAGTGSTCRLLKEDGEVYGCGGWGHLITDYASGFWISQQAVRTLFDVEDGYTKIENKEEASIESLKAIILKHFKIESKLSLLNIFYGPKFNKAKIASLCEALAAEGQNNSIIGRIFYEAGCHLARMLIAVSKNFDQEMYDIVPVLAIGSVWKSWSLLKPGFVQTLKEETLIRRVSIYQLEESPRIGAAVLAAKIKLGENFDSKDTRGKTRLIDEIRNSH